MNGRQEKGRRIVRALLLSVSLVVFCPGCFYNFKAHSMAVRRVSVQIAAPASEGGTTLSIDGQQVQEAAAIIERVLLSQGFTKFQRNPPLEYRAQTVADEKARGVVACYYHGHCEVTFRDNVVRVTFTERYMMHSSPEVKAACKTLQSELAKRYGAGRVNGRAHHED